MRKVISLIFIFIYSYIPLQAQSFEYFYQGVLFSCKLKDKKVCITSFDVKAQRVTIPAYAAYQGVKYPVIEISTYVSGNNYSARELFIEEGVEEIGKRSFYEFRKLRNVTLPSTIIHIGKSAFRNMKEMAFHMSPNIDESIIRKGQECFVTRHIIGSNNTTNVGNDEIRLRSELERQEEERIRSAQQKLINREKEEQNVKAYQLANYDVDSNIPVTTNSNDKTYCVIIANEHYKNTPNVNYAINDGKIFKEYCHKTLGVPDRNIKFYEDAGYLDMLEAIQNLQSIKYLGSDVKLIFYYSGHGIPNEKDRTAFLLPVDGRPGMMQESCISLRYLFKNLGEMDAKNVTVFLDACFSGMQRGSDDAILAVKGVALKTKKEDLEGNVVVLSAASNDQTAQIYGRQRHGLFTYHLLKELKQTQGHVTLGKLYEAIENNVARTSLYELNKPQNPSIGYSNAMREKWKNIYINQ